MPARKKTTGWGAPAPVPHNLKFVDVVIELELGWTGGAPADSQHDVVKALQEALENLEVNEFLGLGHDETTPVYRPVAATIQWSGGILHVEFGNDDEEN